MMICQHLLDALDILLDALLNLEQALEAETDQTEKERLAALIRELAVRIRLLTKLIETLCGPPPAEA